MSDTPIVPAITPWLLPAAPFENLIAQMGQRASWMKAHTCPCIYAGGGPQGRLPSPGTADPACLQCFGVGMYWDPPSDPFPALATFTQMTPTPNEPGVFTNETVGPIQSADPALTIPYLNPSNPNTPNAAWQYAGTDDIFVLPDSTTRYNAVLQAGGITALPYQQNVVIAASGAVSTYDPITQQVSFPSYSTSGTSVIVPSLQQGQNFIVEFQAAPLYVVYRKAGGLPHIRAFGSGQVNLPRKYHLSTLDLWLRQRLGGVATTYSQYANGAILPFIMAQGQVIQT